ncbi:MULTISPECIES: ABC-F family ATP-binding cassette domain-containing protein [Enterobacterales]|uniref:ABC-F family ATP-binding cassette domain-containing protein n=1 Tax=Enterobacterales TaxID=91347 RepID=UPI002EDA49EE
MSTLLSTHSLCMETAFGPLFSDLSFTLKKGDRVGLIGYNGCGKSTLLKLLDGSLAPSSGYVTQASACLVARVEQHLPDSLAPLTLLEAVLDNIPHSEHDSQRWRVEALLAEMGFSLADTALTSATLSGGQHTRLLLARALIKQPDVLLLDEPSNHLDLPTLLWLESFIKSWNGSFILVSHDRQLLDNVTNTSWVLRDQKVHCFSLPCSAARQALAERDESDALRFKAEQKEIDRVAASAKRLATWGHVYDNEDLSRKAKQMEKQVERLKESQTDVTAGSQWQLQLHGDALQADRLLELENLAVSPALQASALFSVPIARLKSGDRVALIGRNGCGKSSLLRLIWQQYCDNSETNALKIHPRVNLGYYDQTLHQLPDDATLFDALEPFAPAPEDRKMALISAGFPWIRHGQRVDSLSGGERSRLLFVGLTLARYSLLLLDEPTNHLDMEGKEALAETLQTFAGGVLLVSHDRHLMQQSCNRFWLIHNGQLEEWHDADAAWARLSEQHQPEQQRQSASAPVELNHDNDALLERLVLLETLLAEDKARKPKHQKPQSQKVWQEEIAELTQRLETL